MKTHQYLILIGSALVLMNALGDSLFGESLYIVLPIWGAAGTCLLLGIRGTRLHDPGPLQPVQSARAQTCVRFITFVSLLSGAVCAFVLIRYSHPHFSGLTALWISGVAFFVGISIVCLQGAYKKRPGNGSEKAWQNRKRES
jgi:hypothetical protein